MRSVLYNEKVLTWTVGGFLTPDESKQLADKVITMIADYEGTPDEMGRLNRYMGQSHRYTKSQERDIVSMWGIFTHIGRRKARLDKLRRKE